MRRRCCLYGSRSSGRTALVAGRREAYAWIVRRPAPCEPGCWLLRVHLRRRSRTCNRLQTSAPGASACDRTCRDALAPESVGVQARAIMCPQPQAAEGCSARKKPMLRISSVFNDLVLSSIPLPQWQKKLSQSSPLGGLHLTILKSGNIHVLRSTQSRGQLLVATQAELDVVTNAGIERQNLLEKLARVAGGQKKISCLVHTIVNSPAAKLSALVRTIPYDAGAPPALTELLRRVRAGAPRGTRLRAIDCTGTWRRPW